MTIGIASLIFSSCGNKPIIEEKFSVDSVYISSDPVVPVYDTTDISVFTNIEMVEYCLLLPLKEFEEDFSDQSLQKACHNFKPRNKKDSVGSISLRGLLLDKEEKISLKNIYERDIAQIQEDGLGIDTSFVMATEKYFVVKGYLPNFADKKFFRIVWLAEDEVVLEINFDKKDAFKWEQRLSAILRNGISCQ